MTCGVYAIRNFITGKVYVGGSENIERRWKQHRAYLDQNCHDCKALQDAWNRLGSGAFELTVLEVTDYRRLPFAEEEWIQKCAGLEAGVYNVQLTVLPTPGPYRVARLGARLVDWRNRSCLSQTMLSEMSGVSVSTISQIELGNHRPRPSTIRRIAAALECKPMWIDEFAEAMGRDTTPPSAPPEDDR